MNRQAMLLLCIGAATLGAGSLIVAESHVGSYAIAFWRLLIGTIVFGVWTRVCGYQIPKILGTWGFSALAGVFLCGDLGLWHESVHAVGPGIATLLNSLQIFFMAAMGRFFFGEKVRLSQIMGLVLAIIGVWLISSQEYDVNNRAVWGLVSGVLSAIMFAFCMGSIRKIHDFERCALVPVMFILSFSGMIAILPLAITFNAHSFWPTQGSDIAYVLTYGLVMQCIAWAIVTQNIPKVSLVLAGLAMLFEPVSALILDYVLLHKDIDRLQWFGAALTLVAIYLGSVSRSARREKKSS